MVESDPPDYALARLLLSEWEIGDRWRLLIVLAERILPARGIRDILAGARARSATLIELGPCGGLHRPPAGAGARHGVGGDGDGAATVGERQVLG